MKCYHLQAAIAILVAIVVGLIGVAVHLVLTPPPLADRYRGWSTDGSTLTSPYCHAQQYPPQLFCLSHEGLPVPVRYYESLSTAND